MSSSEPLQFFPSEVSKNSSADSTMTDSLQSGQIGFYFRLILITIQLALVLFTIHSFQIEKDQGVMLILPVIFFGFIVYHLLPNRLKLPFFFLLTVAAMTQVLNWKAALLGTGTGIALLLICHIPVRISFRLVILISVGSGLAYLYKNSALPQDLTSAIPIVASMFMFRIFLYLHEMSKKTTEVVSLWQRLCYFFLLPNVCFLVFPIVDFKAFLQGFDQKNRIEVMQKGINWIFWGILQLLAYRIIYYYWVPDPSDVIDFRSLVIYLITGYMFLLRICGQAYVAIGIVCLFGFDLPVTFHNFFLATGFSDYWRRTNIYWTNFMIKIFYYRIFFRLRKLKRKLAVALTLCVTFLITWLLHSYQFFWLKRVFPLTAVDGLFWGIFGALIAVNGVRELKQKAKKSLGGQEWSYRVALRKTLQWVFFFSFMCLLWSLWGSGTVGQWLNTLKASENITGSEVLVALMILGSTIVFAIFVQRLHHWLNHRLPARSFPIQAFATIVIMVAILGLKTNASSPQRQELLFSKFIQSIEEPRLNKRDLDIQFRGYYEPLMSRETFMAEFVEGPILDPHRPSEHFDSRRMRAEKQRSNFVVNDWNMRDKDYTVAKPENTYRIAILGGSIEKGSGVGNEEVFEGITENRLNAENSGRNRHEILNFSLSYVDIIEQVNILKTRVFQFSPDAVFYFAHSEDEGVIAKNMARRIKSPKEFNDDIFKPVIERSGLNASMDLYEISRRMKTYSPVILELGMENIAKECRRKNVIPVWIGLRTPLSTMKVKERMKIAQKYGFITIDLSEAYGNEHPRFLTVAPWDNHPNARGHALIAEALYKKIIENKDKLRMQIQN